MPEYVHFAKSITETEFRVWYLLDKVWEVSEKYLSLAFNILHK